MMTSRASLMVASWDEMLLRTRSLMLGTYFSVQSVGRFSEAVLFIRQTPYDLLVLCHTLSEEQQQFLVVTARSVFPHTCVLSLCCEELQPDRPYADCTFDSRLGPYPLVRRCAELVGYTIKNKTRHLARAS